MRRIKGSDVLKYRQKHGYSQTLFWETFGVTQSGGSRYEGGRAIPEPVQILLRHEMYGEEIPTVSA